MQANERHSFFMCREVEEKAVLLEESCLRKRRNCELCNEERRAMKKARATGSSF